MSPHRRLEGVGAARRPPLAGAFHDYVISVFLERVTLAQELNARRARRMYRLRQYRSKSEAEQRWENEGGNAV